MSTRGQEEDKKPGHGSSYVNLKVHCQDGHHFRFRIKRSSPLKLLMNAYCDKRALDFNYFVFLYDGSLIRREQTPDELGMEDDHVIDAMLHNSGGAYA